MEILVKLMERSGRLLKKKDFQRGKGGGSGGTAQLYTKKEKEKRVMRYGQSHSAGVGIILTDTWSPEGREEGALRF